VTTKDLGFRGRVLPVGWELPSDLSEAEWRQAGEILGKVEHSVSWWLGDWWKFGETRYGARKAIVESDNWDGPSYQTCRDAAWVVGKFPLSRRRDNLAFAHHKEVAGLARQEEAYRLLNWCEETIPVTRKPRLTAELRKAVRSAIRDRKRTEHSRKPREFYEIIETLYTHGRKLELFARSGRTGWDSVGNEFFHMKAAA
jgi:MT-A70